MTAGHAAAEPAPARADADVDGVLLGALAVKLQAIAVEMGFALKRTARSLYVRDGEDFCTSVAGVDGLLLTAPDTVGSTLLTLVDCSAAVAAVGDLGPGDVLITNDAFTSGGLSTHLADIHVVEPYYVGDRLVGYGWAFIHASDVGGRVPSSISPFNTDVFSEGLRIPPVRLVKSGRIDPEIEAFVRAASRTPDANAADIRAMLAALRTGRHAVTETVRRIGVEAYLTAQRELLASSERRAREVFARLPPGRYSFSDFLDDDAVTRHPVRLAAAVEVGPDGELHVDFTGTEPQIGSAFNIASGGGPHPMTTGRVRSTLATLDGAMPLDGGQVRAVRVTAPEGSVVNAVHPAAVGVRHGSAVRVSDTLGGALLQAAPQVLPAAGSGIVVPVVVSERRGNGRSSQVLTRLFGGFGAARGLDGHDGKDNSYSNLPASPMETGEAELAVHVLAHRLRPDSAGPGRWRGGVGRELSFRVEADDTQVLARGLDRFVFRPWGAFGGRPAAPTEVVVNEGRPDERRHRKIDVLSLGPGDTVTIRTPGGGGYGDPIDRDPAAVLVDIERELVSPRSAREDYGVVLSGREGDPLAVDAVATAELRDALRAAAPPDAEPFDLGPERRAWDEVFSPTWYDTAVAGWFLLPPVRRTQERAHVLDTVLAHLPEDFPADPGTPEQRARAAAIAWGLVTR